MSADRKVEPIPKATVSADSESGRSISGRIGMSLASTVSSVIDVPVTHSSSAAIWPAWTDAISSSSAVEDRAAGLPDPRLRPGRPRSRA